MSPIFTSSKFGFAAGSAASAAASVWVSPAAGALFSGKTIFESEVSTSAVTFNAGGGGTYSMTGGPSGGLYSSSLLAVNSSTGVLTGNFGDDGTYSITATSSLAGNRAFTITVAEDLSIGKFSNLKIWMRGGYNGNSAGNCADGDDTLVLYGGSTGSNKFRVYNGGTSPSYVAYNETPSATTSLGASGSGIRDAKGGATAALQDDLLYYKQPGNSLVWLDDVTGSSFVDGVNHTFCWWMYMPNIANVTGSNQFSPIWHSWDGTNATSFVALDWYTGGTSNQTMQNYVAGGLYGTWNVSTITAGTNGNKDVWFHVAQVYTSGTTKCYLNGSVDATLTAPTSAWGAVGTAQVVSMNSRGEPVSGTNPPGGASASQSDKWFADNRYYNTNLSAAEIQDIYQKGRSAFA